MELGPDARDADALAVVSRVNRGVRSVDDVVGESLERQSVCIGKLTGKNTAQAFGDDRDDLVEQINLHGNEVETMDGLETFTRWNWTGGGFDFFWMLDLT